MKQQFSAVLIKKGSCFKTLILMRCWTSTVTFSTCLKFTHLTEESAFCFVSGETQLWSDSRVNYMSTNVPNRRRRKYQLDMRGLGSVCLLKLMCNQLRLVSCRVSGHLRPICSSPTPSHQHLWCNVVRKPLEDRWHSSNPLKTLQHYK